MLRRSIMPGDSSTGWGCGRPACCAERRLREGAAKSFALVAAPVGGGERRRGAYRSSLRARARERQRDAAILSLRSYACGLDVAAFGFGEVKEGWPGVSLFVAALTVCVRKQRRWLAGWKPTKT
jgi:hypothetical protein